MPDQDPKSHCLIVADGEVLVRNVLAEYLRECGYKVIEAANSDEVVAVMQESSTTIDAILLDANLQGTMNAFELRMWARKRNPALEIVLAGTVVAAAHAAGDFCDEGPHLKRPYDPQAVLQHIKRLLAKARK